MYFRTFTVRWHLSRAACVKEQVQWCISFFHCGGIIIYRYNYMVHECKTILLYCIIINSNFIINNSNLPAWLLQWWMVIIADTTLNLSEQLAHMQLQKIASSHDDSMLINCSLVWSLQKKTLLFTINRSIVCNLKL